MTNGNGDFPYWEGDRTQPAGTTEAESNIRPEQLEALQSYLSQRTAAAAVGATFPPQHPSFPTYQMNLPQEPPKQQAIANPSEHPTISITTGKTRIDITITPL